MDIFEEDFRKPKYLADERFNNFIVFVSEPECCLILKEFYARHFNTSNYWDWYSQQSSWKRRYYPQSSWKRREYLFQTP